MNKGLALFLACALSLGFAVTVLAAEDAAQAKEGRRRRRSRKSWSG
jgi:hypothetical protein